MHIEKQAKVMINANGVGVKFNMGRKGETLKSLVLNPRISFGEFWALKDVSFKGLSGDVIGIIGPNGAGKTTLCRVIANLLKTDTGKIDVYGEVSALLSLGTGFNRELTGRENVLLNGMMLGARKADLLRIMDDIIEFSGLGDFIDQPIKKYSSGMRARLGFSIASMLNPEVLVLDEALSTGDLEFTERAIAKTKELVKRARLVIIVSHDLDFIEKNCSKVIWIENGQIVLEGASHYVCSQYVAKITANKSKKATPPRRLKIQKTNTKIGKEVVIEAQSLGLRYKINRHDFWALQNCSFKIYQGEIVGVIGANGAGKSTLCKIICGILKPDAGQISVKGKISALLSLGTGFNAELTGRDNIFLNGLLLGIPKKTLEDLYDEIVAFSGLGDFINVPVKNYSKGMLSRLGFSIATTLRPDILIIDEALSTGDMSFFEKATQRIQEIIASAKAVIIVTHSMSFVKRVCNKAMWIKNGHLMHIGKPELTVSMYQDDRKAMHSWQPVTNSRIAKS